MSIPTNAAENQLISSARRRGAELIRALVTTTGVSPDVLCERAAEAVDRFCADLLGGLITAAVPLAGPESAWVRRHYLPLITEFGTGVRDALEDPTLRHAAAQAIQCKILEHERRLRIVLDSAAADYGLIADAAQSDARAGDPQRNRQH